MPLPETCLMLFENRHRAWPTTGPARSSCRSYYVSWRSVDGSTGYEGFPHLALRAQNDQVCVGSWGNPSLGGKTEDRSRGGRGHAKGLVQGYVQQPSGVAEGSVHGQDAAGERSVGRPYGPRLEPYRAFADLVLSIRHAGGLHGVGDEGQGIRAFLTVGYLEGGLMHMDAVGDYSDACPVVGEQRSHRPGRAVL